MPTVHNRRVIEQLEQAARDNKTIKAEFEFSTKHIFGKNERTLLGLPVEEMSSVEDQIAELRTRIERLEQGRTTNGLIRVASSEEIGKYG